MELVFALITYLGIQIVDTSFFRSIDDCMYYAKRINNQPSVPSKNKAEKPQTQKYVAVCTPRKIDVEKAKIY